MLRTILLAFALTACSTVPDHGQSSVVDGSKVAWSLSGKGQPVVVLQSGLGDDRNAWATVFAALAAHYPVFAYDRPGYGASQSKPGPRDPCTIAVELHQLLHAAGVSPPYVLVGHSIGGLYQYAYARLYPDEVAGLVLVDATHPDHWRNMQNQAGAQAALLKGMRAAVFTPAMRPEFDDQDQCLARFAGAVPLGKPVRVLVRTRFDLLEQGGFEAQIHQEEAGWLVLTGAGQVQSVNSGHYIQQEQPQAVVDAVTGVVHEAGY
ncbi:pimeloyl-ACP methyl ester carboxylesterase [Silvimonas terrae]|uniref:Pimeloyl-ACP methyl ester carboxylesterase n=1 Tax=Silvimonas terrae TaxID=300266 RepID=A0A840REF0_9NEIS|nr:alpha/beta hydrolase [Silvimonas terrae]MBB5190631.1 pimeloyl-ACP methyl ester carboxylesterase [Silvimonas terrae]